MPCKSPNVKLHIAILNKLKDSTIIILSLYNQLNNKVEIVQLNDIYSLSQQNNFMTQ